ncbi:hypothetical protein UXP85_25450 [Enterobacter cloacae]|uniref:hypothetical protein n=1 Tax=Enterobacter cloacae TaxID=550 RepID=UPI002FD69105
MKLIDILVERLPALGGWPIDSDDERTLISSLPGVSWGLNGGGYYAFRGPNDSITYQQYEAARLAASKTEWDGDGMPPVGADVQCICNQFPSEGQEKLLGKILYSGEYTILHTYKTNEQHHVPVESVLMTKHWSITPIRSEADKKREIGVLSLARADPTVGRFEYGEKMSDGRLIGYAWYELYDKIAAGEVAGIRID